MKYYIVFAFLINTAILAAQFPPLCFATATAYPSGNNYAIVAEDINHDAFPDLIVPDADKDKIVVMINTGNGTYTLQPGLFSTGQYPVDIVAADFTLDGEIDVITVNSYPNSITMLPGNGNGTFNSKITFSVPLYPQAIVKGDFNIDGMPDIAVSSFNGAFVSVFLNNGTGSFLQPIHYPVATGGFALIVGDFNNDSIEDIVHGGQFNDLYVFYGVGNGTFQPVKKIPVSYSGNHLSALLAADFNIDGLDDIVYCDNYNNLFAMFGASGNTFSSPQKISTNNNGQYIEHMDALDINNDGHLDLITPQPLIYFGKSDGSFSLTNSYTATTANFAIVAKDLNLDGKIDLASSGMFVVHAGGPWLSVPQLPTICKGFILTLQPSGAASYTVKNTGQSGKNVVVSPTVTTTYSISGSWLNGCTSTTTVTVNVFTDNDPAYLASLYMEIPTGPVCAGDYVTICARGATQGLRWMDSSTTSCISRILTTTTHYSVVATNSVGCKKNMEHLQIVKQCVDIKQHETVQAFEVFSDPVNGRLHLKNFQEGLFIKIFDISGKILYSRVLHDKEETLQLDLPAGLYLIASNSDGHATVKKVIVH
jgi:hypothetical protein